MAVNHRKDSIQLIRDTEGINNKDRVRILSPGSSPPGEQTEVTEHALYMELENTPGDGEPYEYEFACCTGRRFIPQRAGDANKLEGKTSAEVKALFADGRAIFAGSGTSVTLDAEGDRVHSITVNGFTKQDGEGDASPVNVREILVGGMQANLFPGFTKCGVYNSETGEFSDNQDGNVVSDKFACKPNTEYFISVNYKADASLGLRFWRSDGSYVGYKSLTIGAKNPAYAFTTPSDATVMVVTAYAAGAKPEDFYDQVMVYGSNRGPYTKYTGAEYGVALEQHGTNILPKNASGASTQTGVTFTPNEDGTIYAKGTATADADYYTFGSYTSYDVKFVLSPGEYFLSGGISGVVLYLLSRTNSGVKNVASTITEAGTKFTVEDYTPITAFLARAVNGRKVDGVIKPMLNIGSTALPYVQFAGFKRDIAPLTAPLCAGDKFISRTLSGCDYEITFDGSSDENWSVNTGSSTAESGSRRFTIDLEIDTGNHSPNERSVAYSNYLVQAKPNETYSQYFDDCFSVENKNVQVRISGIDTVEELRAFLSARPLKVKFRTSNYNRDNDIAVSMETHNRVVVTMDGTMYVGDVSNMGDVTRGMIRPTYSLKAPGSYQTSAKCSHFVQSNSWVSKTQSFYVNTTPYVFISNDLLDELTNVGIKKFLKTQFDAGTPVQFEYPLATPIVYVHEPVDFEFVDGEDGVFTITGEADGTLDVYYKALQDGGDADKLGGKLPEYYAAAANALGQYTHTKSGTVHELTGTGDNIRFVATADFAAGDTVKVNGTTCTASTMSGDALWAGFFKSGAVVVCYRTGNALNFSGGGLAAAEAAKITPENLKTGVSVTVNGKTVAGTFTADGTAAAGDMLLGKTGYVKGQKVTGTIPSKAAASYKPGTSAQTIKAVQYLSGDQTIEGDAALIAANIKYGASIFDVDGSFTSDANAAAAEILTGKIGYVKGQKITGSMPNRGAVSQWLGINGTYTIPAGYHNGQGVVKQSIPTKGEATYTPSTREQVIEKNQYLTGSQFIKGDGNLVAGNIRSGVSIFGVTGTYTGTVNAACVIMSHQCYDYGDDAQYTINQSANIVSHVSTNKGVVTFKFNLTKRVYVTSTFFKSADNDAVGACSINGWVNATAGQTFTITTTIGANGHGNNKRVIAAVSIAY